MKNKPYSSSIVTLAGILLFALIVVSCIKEGPEGPQGPTGNANVKTYPFSADLSGFQLVNTSGEYYTTIDFTTVDIGSNDAVLVYYDRETVNSVDYWAQLPFDDWYSSTLYNHFSFEIGDNSKMFINIRNSSGVEPYSPMTGTLYFKAVVIRGYAGKKAVIPASLNTGNYSEVRNYYKLAD
jgi:hypothetical protein